MLVGEQEQTYDGQPEPTRIATREDFAAGLTALRTSCGLTVRQVAKNTGIPSGTLGDYYSGRHLPPTTRRDVLTKILRACDVTDEVTVREWHEALVRVTDNSRNGPIPYRGLEVFQREHADWFFGRERLTCALVEKLADHYRRGGLLVVIGVSGSGKSSLLRAGLVPMLNHGRLGDRCDLDDLDMPDSQNWPWLLFTPGDHPLKELATQLAEKTQRTPADVEENLRADPRAAADFARRACGAAVSGSTPSGSAAAGPGHGSRLVVVVDQFEEVFTSCSDEAERSDFIAALGAAAGGGSVEPADTAPDERCSPAALVVLGLRADFYSQALRRSELLPAMQGGQVVVGPMTEDELRDVIVKPAEKAGVDLEDGLVELLLRDLRPAVGHPVPVAHEAGTLPRLSHALRITWEGRRHGRMTVAEYKASGTIRAAVAQSAEEAFGELTSTQQEAARWLFLRLVRIADDTADTRRRVSRAKLLDSPGHTRPEESAAVLDQFANRWLITVDDRDQVEIAHDSLLSAWPRLRGWIDADRAGLLVAQRLTDDAHIWQAEGRDPGRLYRGNQLTLAAEWARSTGRPRKDLDLPQVARDFLGASLAARRRWARIRTVAAAVMAILLAFSATAALVAYRAEGDRREDISRALASEAEALRVKQPYFALLLGIEAYRIAPTNEARNSLLDRQRSYKMMTPTCGEPGQPCHRGPVSAVIWGDSGRGDGTGILVTAGHDGYVNIWRTSPDGSPPVHEKVFRHGGPVLSAALSADGSTVVTAGDGVIRAWDVGSGEQNDFDLGDDKEVYGIAVHPDGVVVAGAGRDGVRLWNRADGTVIAELGSENDSVPAYAVAFSPDSRLLASAHGDGTVKIWDARALLSPATSAASRDPLRELRGHPEPVRVLAFSSDSETLASGGESDVLLWETADDLLENSNGPDEFRRIPDEQRVGQVRSLIFSPGVGEEVVTGSDRLLVGGDDASVRILDAATNLGLDSLYTGPTGRIQGVAFSPDGKTIAGVGADAAIALWRVRAEPGDEADDGDTPSDPADTPEEVVDWVCTHYYPTPTLPAWPESISDEFRRPIC